MATSGRKGTREAANRIINTSGGGVIVLMSRLRADEPLRMSNGEGGRVAVGWRAEKVSSGVTGGDGIHRLPQE